MELSFLWESLLDLLFPPRCVSCAADEAWWCATCRLRVEHPHETATLEGLDGLCILGYYHDPILRAAIQALKYQGLTALRPVLREFVIERRTLLKRILPFSETISVQPLPASPKRKRMRGFDQAEVLAELLVASGVVEGQRIDLLHRREGSGLAQARLADHTLRAANVVNVFELRRIPLMPEKVLLVDDVVTSGATMQAAARLLRAQGVKRVYGFALALGA